MIVRVRLLLLVVGVVAFGAALKHRYRMDAVGGDRLSPRRALLLRISCPATGRAAAA